MAVWHRLACLDNQDNQEATRGKHGTKRCGWDIVWHCLVACGCNTIPIYSQKTQKTSPSGGGQALPRSNTTEQVGCGPSHKGRIHGGRFRLCSRAEWGDGARVENGILGRPGGCLRPRPRSQGAAALVCLIPTFSTNKPLGLGFLSVCPPAPENFL